MRRFGAPVATVAVYVLAVAFWAFAMLFAYNILGMVFRGHIEKYWFVLLILMFGLGVFFAEISRYLIRIGVPKAAALFQPAAPGGVNVQITNPLMIKETTAMAKNESPSFTFSAPVTINTATNHNAPGGIISNAPVTVHQHFDKPTPPPPTPDVQTRDAVVVDGKDETASLDELHKHAETLMGRAISEGTIRNVLERNGVKSCGEEKRGRAWALLYPKERAEKILADYVKINKRK